MRTTNMVMAAYILKYAYNFHPKLSFQRTDT